MMLRYVCMYTPQVGNIEVQKLVQFSSEWVVHDELKNSLQIQGSGGCTVQTAKTKDDITHLSTLLSDMVML